jgi:hypothetical protein
VLFERPEMLPIEDIRKDKLLNKMGGGKPRCCFCRKKHTEEDVCLVTGMKYASDEASHWDWRDAGPAFMIESGGMGDGMAEAQNFIDKGNLAGWLAFSHGTGWRFADPADALGVDWVRECGATLSQHISQISLIPGMSDNQFRKILRVSKYDENYQRRLMHSLEELNVLRREVSLGRTLSEDEINALTHGKPCPGFLSAMVKNKANPNSIAYAVSKSAYWQPEELEQAIGSTWFDCLERISMAAGARSAHEYGDWLYGMEYASETFRGGGTEPGSYGTYNNWRTALASGVNRMCGNAYGILHLSYFMNNNDLAEVFLALTDGHHGSVIFDRKSLIDEAIHRDYWPLTKALLGSGNSRFLRIEDKRRLARKASVSQDPEILDMFLQLPSELKPEVMDLWREVAAETVPIKRCGFSVHSLVQHGFTQEQAEQIMENVYAE